MPLPSNCGNCGCPGEHVTYNRMDDGTYFIKCMRCGFAGPIYSEEQKAVEAWNSIMENMERGKVSDEIVEEKFIVKINGELEVTRDQLKQLMTDISWNSYDKFTVNVYPVGDATMNNQIMYRGEEKKDIFDKIFNDKSINDITDYTMRLK